MARLLYDAIERTQLCDLLDEVGSQAPTLLDPWTTHDLAAHLVLREHDLSAAPGLSFPVLWGRFAERRRVASGKQRSQTSRDHSIRAPAQVLSDRMGA